MAIRYDPVMAYNFLITFVDSTSSLSTALGSIQSTASAGFSECGGLDTTLQLEEHPEGGNNGTVLKFPKRVTWTNLRLKRGIARDDSLWRWYYSFVEGKGKRRDGLIILRNDRRVPVRVWQFERGIPTRWNGPALNATQSSLAFEELEIAHEGLKTLSVADQLSAALGDLLG